MGVTRAGNGPLPPGWEARKTLEGKRYYVCHETKQTSWQRPASVNPTPTAASTKTMRPKAQQKRHSSMPQQSSVQSQVQAPLQYISSAPQIATLTPATAQPSTQVVLGCPNTDVTATQTPVPMTAEEEKNAREAEKKKNARKKLMVKMGTSVLKGVVSGTISAIT